MTSEAVVNSEELDMIQNTLADTADAAVAAVENAAHHYGAFYENPEFWVGVAFVMVVILLAKPVGGLIKSMMNKRIDGIAKRINDAAELRDEAQKLLADYEKKFLNAEISHKEFLPGLRSYHTIGIKSLFSLKFFYNLLGFRSVNSVYCNSGNIGIIVFSVKLPVIVGCDNFSQNFRTF